MPYTALLMKTVVMFFPARRGVDQFVGADRGQIPVALIGKDDQVRIRALDAGGHGRCAAVGSFGKIALKVVVGQDRAAHRSDAHSSFPDAQLVHDLGDQPVGDAMDAAGTVVGDHIRQGFGPAKDQFCLFCHSNSPSRGETKRSEQVARACK